MADSNTISGEDLVYYSKNGVIQAGGYSINSTLLKNNIPAVYGGKKQKSTKINMSENDNESKVSDKFNNISTSEYGPIEICEMDDVVSDDLYSKLVNLAEINEKEHKKKATRGKKHKTSKGKKTKRVIKY